jgi:hypothetical protein
VIGLIESLPGGQKVVDIARRCRCPPAKPKPSATKDDQLLNQISEFCRQADKAESAFGRRAVNDGKLVHLSGIPELIRPPRSLTLRLDRSFR